MKAVPVFIFEEHHEAFFIWHYSIMNKLIKKSGNILLHIDEHSDLGVPRLNYSIKTLDNLQDIYKFTYSELTIGNFIVPAIYQGIFEQLYWLRQGTSKGKEKQIVFVYSHGGEGKVLTIGRDSEVGNLACFNPDYKSVMYQNITTYNDFADSPLVVLDIDLDYFSCNHQYHQSKGQLEVTKAQYDSFTKNKYHFLRFLLGSSVEAKAEDGRYYILFNCFQSEAIPNKLKVSEQEIIKRIDLLIKFLRDKNVKPQIIDICRSRMSGFTPEDQWKFIEKKLIEKLSTLYEIEINHIEEILVRENIELMASKRLCTYS